ncbi:MAG: hypothetical protein MMC33_009713 [Icmadophila ericetorum]|nr:hypothetical protein [Icmadophila ericetorum]
MQAISEEKRQASQETTATAMVATQLRPNKKVVRVCTGCRKVGHSEETCYKLHPKLRSKKRKRTSSEKQPATEEANYWVFEEPPVRANMATTHEKAKPDEFILDSGCTKTSALSRDHFRTYRTPSFLPTIRGIGGSEVRPIGIGEIEISYQTSERPITMVMEAFHCPELGANLISTPQLVRSGAKVEFSGLTVSLGHKRKKITGTLNNGLYTLDTVPKHPSSATAYQALSVPIQPGLAL